MEGVLSFITDLKDVRQPVAVICSKLLNLSDLLDTLSFTESEQAFLKETLSQTLIPILRHWSGLSKEGADLFPICSELSRTFVVPRSTDNAVEIKKVAYTLFISGKSAKARLSGLELLQSCFQKYPGSAMYVRFEGEACARGFIGTISQPSKNSSSILRQVNICLGLLCQSYPTHMSDYSEDILR